MNNEIHYIKRKQLDVAKYDTCIKLAANSRIYAYSWYLDIVADAWDVLVLGDYLAVMPLPKRKKYFIDYVYTPFWVAELGVFFRKELNSDLYQEVIIAFINDMKKRFSQIDILLNFSNKNMNISYPVKLSQRLDISKEYEVIFKNYRKGRKSDLSKARRNNLQIKWNDDTKNLIVLHKENVGNKLNSFKDRDYAVLEQLIEEAKIRKIGKIISVFDINNQLLASTFILKNKSVITALVTASDLKFRKNGATSFLYNGVIKEYSNKDYIFDFAGSSVTSIAEFFKSFGAKDVKKFHVSKYHCLYYFAKKLKTV